MGLELPADVTVILMTMVDPRSSGRPNEADATSNSNLDSISVSFLDSQQPYWNVSIGDLTIRNDT